MYEHEDIASVMEEPPEGENRGFVTISWVDDDSGVRVAKTPLGPRFAQLERDRYGIVSGKNDGGLVAHRGVTTDDEHVDATELRVLVEAALGFTYEQIGSVYRQGPLSADQRQLRDKIDSRLLALSHSGGNMLALARALDWAVDDGGKGANSRTMERALSRARKAS